MVYDSRDLMQPSRFAPEVEIVCPEDFRRLGEALGCRTQHEFAQRLGVTQARVSQILSGAHPLKPGPLLTLVRSLQVQYGLASGRGKRR